MNLFGTVYGDDGAPAIAADVALYTNVDAAATATTTTNSDGYWQFLSLAADKYWVKITFGTSVRWVDPTLSLQVTMLYGADGTTAPLPADSITHAMLKANTVETDNIADDAVTEAKVGSGAAVSGKVMMADGAGGATWGDAGDIGSTNFQTMVVLTTTQTWTRPAGVNLVDVIVIGGGGSGGNSGSGGSSASACGGGGGGGGYARGIYTVNSDVSVTVGAAGGTSSFGSFCSATGGGSGTSGGSSGSGSRSGGSGGTGTDGTLNITGGTGGAGFRSAGELSGNPPAIGGMGGSTPLGNGGGGGASGDGADSGSSGSGYGAGGGGGAKSGGGFGGGSGGLGRPGVVIIRY